MEVAKAPNAARAGSSFSHPCARTCARRKIKPLNTQVNTQENTIPSFAELGIIEPLCHMLAAKNYTSPTPIQAKSIPILLEGHDILGIAQTGTGKTAAFALPILQILKAGGGKRAPRALIMAPTRELVIQIADDVRSYGASTKLRVAMIFGGVSQKAQVDKMRQGVDIIVATPGRLLDLMDQGHVKLGTVEHLVLDEADRMLDMGFIHDVRKIIAKIPRERQSLLFSATMPNAVESLSKDILSNPARIDIAPKTVTVKAIKQCVHFVETGAKISLLRNLMADQSFKRVIVFTRTKHRANRVAETLVKAGVLAEAIHGNKSQGARQRALENFRKGKARVLVATDIAARGIDVPGVTHVINFEIPNEPESYVHRIGRTARAGNTGIALSFCDSTEYAYLRDIETLIRMTIPSENGERPANIATAKPPKKGGNNRGGQGRPNKNQRHNRPRRQGKPSRRAA